MATICYLLLLVISYACGAVSDSAVGLLSLVTAAGVVVGSNDKKRGVRTKTNKNELLFLAIHH